LRGIPKNQFASFRGFNPRKLAISKTLNPPKSTLAQGPQAFFTDDELCDVDQIQRLSGWVRLIRDQLREGAMMLTLGRLSALFDVLAMLWADGRLARGFLHSLFSC
jgi:hypothetical protein